MADSLDTVSKQLSASIETKRGIAALLVSSADIEQRALDVCSVVAAERDEYKSKYEKKNEECNDLKAQLAEARALIEKLTQKPSVNVTLNGKAKVTRLITGNVNEFYAQDDSNQRQYNKRVGAGRETLSLV